MFYVLVGAVFFFGGLFWREQAFFSAFLLATIGAPSRRRSKMEMERGVATGRGLPGLAAI